MGLELASLCHHIIIISILKPVFLYRGLGLFDKSSSKTSSPLRTVHRVSKIHSKPLSVIHQHFIPGFRLFCATTFSLRTLAIQPVLRCTCPNHLILLVWSTMSRSWMPSFERRESELTSSLALTLQIQRIIARSFAASG